LVSQNKAEGKGRGKFLLVYNWCAMLLSYDVSLLVCEIKVCLFMFLLKSMQKLVVAHCPHGGWSTRLQKHHDSGIIVSAFAKQFLKTLAN
jgi:hypothetical protein